MEHKKRIEWIDLMKGFCIILVVMHNGGALNELEHIDFFRTLVNVALMPLYFLLSGLFFRSYGSFPAFAARKFRLLVVPIIVFGPLGGMLLDCVPWTEWSLSRLCDPARWVVYWSSFVNIPLWFLRALFVGSLIMYGLRAMRQHGAAIAALIVLAASLGVYWFSACIPQLGEVERKMVMRCGLFQASAMLPFLFAGCAIGRCGIAGLQRSPRNMRMAAVACVAGAVVCALMPSGKVSWCMLVFELSPLSILAGFVAAAAVVWGISFLLDRLPYVSYLGRYSIVVLVTHFPLIYALRASSGMGALAASLTVLAVMPAVVWACVRYIPWACGLPSRPATPSVADVLK